MCWTRAPCTWPVSTKTAAATGLRSTSVIRTSSRRLPQQAWISGIRPTYWSTPAWQPMSSGRPRWTGPSGGAVHPRTREVYMTLTNNTSRTEDNIDAANPRAVNRTGHIRRQFHEQLAGQRRRIPASGRSRRDVEPQRPAPALGNHRHHPRRRPRCGAVRQRLTPLTGSTSGRDAHPRHASPVAPVDLLTESADAGPGVPELNLK